MTESDKTAELFFKLKAEVSPEAEKDQPAGYDFSGIKKQRVKRKTIRKEQISVLPKNKNGHYAFEIVGRDLGGLEEKTYLESAGLFLKDSVLRFLYKGAYNYHRLRNGERYRVVLVPGEEFSDSGVETFRDVNDIAKNKFGYRPAVAGAITRLPEVICHEKMKKIGALSIVTLHNPIQFSPYDAGFLNYTRYNRPYFSMMYENQGEEEDFSACCVEGIFFAFFEE